MSATTPTPAVDVHQLVQEADLGGRQPTGIVKAIILRPASFGRHCNFGIRRRCRFRCGFLY